jgi:hypothetical protein
VPVAVKPIVDVDEGVAVDGFGSGAIIKAIHPMQ